MESRQGQLLISSTDLLDPNFHQTVTLIVQHNEDGALGLTLNRPLEISFSEAWVKVSESPCEYSGALLLGGPCEGPVMLLHSNISYAQLTVMEGLYFCTEQEDVRWLVEHVPENIRCFAGYAGWGPMQLEDELELGSWMTTDATPELVFDDDPSNQWIEILKTINPTQAQMIQNPNIVPNDPSMN
ncbi:YqgE/AlgH family protein [Poriferisphaera sp. WC338]|uniref:YqgE/AlgH family protein n=1 Tax=Poriferisphaera sp. WC338 TaxID=3425129 RepID=UPI003D816106